MYKNKGRPCYAPINISLHQNELKKSQTHTQITNYSIGQNKRKIKNLFVYFLCIDWFWKTKNHQTWLYNLLNHVVPSYVNIIHRHYLPFIIICGMNYTVYSDWHPGNH